MRHPSSHSYFSFKPTLFFFLGDFCAFVPNADFDRDSRASSVRFVISNRLANIVGINPGADWWELCELVRELVSSLHSSPAFELLGHLSRLGLKNLDSFRGIANAAYVVGSI